MQFRRALRLPPVLLALLAAGPLLAGCQPGSNPHAVPSVAQIGADLKCSTGDHGYEDQQAGWGFCYPATWKYTEREQASDNPRGFDLTFDITDAPCATPPAGSTAAPQCSPNAGLFAFMIISTYQRDNATSLASWVATNASQTETVEQTITWGNAVEAARLSDGRRIALTPHHVVILDLHPGLLNLETEMSSRLNTWRFTF